MNNAETYAAAIARLTELRAEADYTIVNGWLVEDHGTSTYVGGGASTPDATPLTDQPLIVALYATLDAQLAILQHTAEALAAWGDLMGRDTVDPDGHALDLARAILGAGA